MTNFTHKTTFERELVKGVLFRNGRIPGRKVTKTFRGKLNGIVSQDEKSLELQECQSNANDSNLGLISLLGDSCLEI